MARSLYTTEQIHCAFWEKVTKTNTCWLWTGSLDFNGYGQFTGAQKHYTAHRYSYELAKGPILGGLFVCHSCDVKRCVNPAHLWVGTHKDNMKDLWQKGLGPKELLTANRKLADVEIKSIYMDDRLNKDIAEAYGVNPSTVSRIKTRKRWLNLNPISI